MLSLLPDGAQRRRLTRTWAVSAHLTAHAFSAFRRFDLNVVGLGNLIGGRQLPRVSRWDTAVGQREGVVPP